MNCAQPAVIRGEWRRANERHARILLHECPILLTGRSPIRTANIENEPHPGRSIRPPWPATCFQVRVTVLMELHTKGDLMIRGRSIVKGLSKWLAILISACFFASGAKAATTTLENMQAAFNGEKNAHARYAAFAEKAKSEGYGEIASLFRAAARAEEVHASNHAAVIEKMGAKPNAAIATPEVKSTRENLETAIKGESYERDTMYPEFLEKARADKNKDAVRSLNLAKTAEAEHAKLYAAALAQIGQLKGSKESTFFVCPVCGFTTREADFSKCPSCFTAKERFERVS